MWMSAALGSPRRKTGCCPVALARATRAPSSWQGWYCGPCRWDSRSARGARAGDRGLWLRLLPARQHGRPRRRIPRPALRQHRRPAPPLLSHFRLSYLCSSVPMAYKGHENIFQHEKLVGSSWIGAYSALCFSCGYDAYGQLDMLCYRLYSGWIPGILMHHLILLICFTLALYRNVTINCLILTLLCKTTYENLQSGGRPNVYDQGCLSNFLEVFCTKVQASKHNFRAYMQEEVRAPPANRFGEVEEELAAARCAKVKDDLGTGCDLMRISFSRQHDYEDIDIERGGGWVGGVFLDM